jgi:hypothetical protein
MLPASDLTEIITNVASLKLEPTTTAAVLGAVLAPLLRSSAPAPDLDEPKIRKTRAGRRRSKPRSARRKRKYKRHAPSEARDRALAALRANPDATPTQIAKIAKVSRSTAANAAREFAKEARKLAPSTVQRIARPFGGADARGGPGARPSSLSAPAFAQTFKYAAGDSRRTRLNTSGPCCCQSSPDRAESLLNARRVASGEPPGFPSTGSAANSLE